MLTPEAGEEGSPEIEQKKKCVQATEAGVGPDPCGGVDGEITRRGAGKQGQYWLSFHGAPPWLEASFFLLGSQRPLCQGEQRSLVPVGSHTVPVKWLGCSSALGPTASFQEDLICGIPEAVDIQETFRSREWLEVQ